MDSTNAISILSGSLAVVLPSVVIDLVNDYLMPTKQSIKHRVRRFQKTIRYLSSCRNKQIHDRLLEHRFYLIPFPQEEYYDDVDEKDFDKGVLVPSNLEPRTCVERDREINEELHNKLTKTFYRKIYKRRREPLLGFKMFSNDRINMVDFKE